MAELNFGLLTPPGSENIGNAFLRGQDQARAAQRQDMQMQQSMRQGQREEFQYRKAQNAEDKLNQFYAHIAKNGGPTDRIEIENKMIDSGIPNVADMGLKARMTRLGLEEDRKRYAEANAPSPALGGAAPMAPSPGSFGAEVATRKAELFGPAPDRTNMMPGAAALVATVNNLSAPPQAKAAIADLNRRIAANMALGTEQGYKTAEGLQKQVTELNRLYAVGTTLMGSEGQIVGTAPAAVPPPRQPNLAADLLIPGPNGTMIPNQTLIGVKTTLAEKSRPPAQPRPEQPAVAVIDPNNPSKIILVSREEAIRRRMTPANTVEKPMTGAQRVRYGKDKVSDKDVVTGAFAVTGELEKLTDELVGNPDKKILPAPGLNSITGYSALTNPLALPKGDARKALQKLDTFKGKIMALGRQLASQEGKLGNMAVQEWKFVSDAVQKLDPAAGNLDEQMRDVVRQSREYALRQQTKYNDTYADDSTAPPVGATGAGVDKSNPLLQ